MINTMSLTPDSKESAHEISVISRNKSIIIMLSTLSILLVLDIVFVVYLSYDLNFAKKVTKKRMKLIDELLGFKEPEKPVVFEPIIHEPDWRTEMGDTSKARIDANHLSRLSPANFFVVNGDHLEISTSIGGTFALVDIACDQNIVARAVLLDEKNFILFRVQDYHAYSRGKDRKSECPAAFAVGYHTLIFQLLFCKPCSAFIAVFHFCFPGESL